MIKTLGIKKSSSMTVIFQTLKAAQRKFVNYEWYKGFTNVLSDIEKLSKLEKRGEAITKEQRDYVFEKLSKFELKSTKLFEDNTTVYDFNELKAKYHADTAARSEIGLANLADSVESMNKLQEDYLPRCNKKQGYGIKKHSGILFFTKAYRKSEISRAFEKAYMVYPGWVAEKVPTAVVHTAGLNEEQLSTKLREIESNFEGKTCVAGQTRGNYRYYALLPSDVDLSIVRLYVLGKVCIPDRVVSEKLLEKRDEMKRVAASINEEITIATRCRDSLSVQLKRLQSKKDDLQRALSSPTVKLSEVANQISALDSEIEKCNNAKKDADAELKRLQAKLEELCTKAKELR